MDYNFSEEQKELQKQIREFAEKEITPYLEQLENDIEYRKKLFVKMAQEGYFTLCVDKKYGGKNCNEVSYSLAIKELAKADGGIAVTLTVTNMVADTICEYGTDEQIKKYLPKIESGEIVPLSLAVTEKEAGSDVKAILTESRQDPDNPEKFVIDGEKHFITDGDISGALLILAKHEGDPHKMTTFLVDRDSPGLTVTKREQKLGLNTVNLVDIQLDRVHLTRDNILGDIGGGLHIALHSIDSGRIGIAAQAVGIAEAAFETALKFAHERVQFGHPIIHHQAVAFKLADMKTKLTAANLMLFQACCQKDSGENFTLEAAQTKLFCSEVANEIAATALDIHGGYGYIKGCNVEKYYRDVRATTIYEGTSDIQRIVISRKL